MNEIAIIVPTHVTMNDFAKVLGQFWSLDSDLAQPSVQLNPYEFAYVAEIEVTPQLEEEMFLEDTVTPGIIRRDFGHYRLFALRYTSPTLARDMARVIASSELAKGPMLLDADGSFLRAADFLARLDERPEWKWIVE
jgi:hypothetical protein